jgi:hypothetical protein
MHARASRSSFLVFGGLFLPHCVLFLLLLAKGKLRGQEYTVLLPWCLLVGACAWLLGFKISITPDRIDYRDGLWRWHSCPRDVVEDASVRWVEYRWVGRRLSIPRLVINCGKGEKHKLVINPKPFSRQAIKCVLETANGEASASLSRP